MMLTKGLRNLLGLAFVNREFAQDLLANPAKATTDFALSGFERRAVRSVRTAQNLAELGAELSRWVQAAAARGKAPEECFWPAPPRIIASRPFPSFQSPTAA